MKREVSGKRMAASLAKQLGLLLFLFGSAFAGNENETEVHHPAFTLSLPGEWSLTLESGDDFWQYESRDGREVISISLYGRPQTKKKNSLRHDFDEIVALRREIEQNVDGKPMEIGNTVVFKHKGVLHGAHAGASRDNSFQTFTCFVMNKRISIVVFYEVRGLSQEERDLRMTKVMESLELKD